MLQHTKNFTPNLEFDSVDRISGLPDSVIHNTILPRLPRKDAVKTSVLSKRWNDLWKTFPDLIFSHYTYTGISNPERQQIVSFLDLVKRSLSRSTRLGVEGIKFCLQIPNSDPEWCPQISECFKLALRSCATEIKLSSWRVPRVVLSGIEVVPHPPGYHFLRELSLDSICLSENALNDIFRSCPNIRKLVLLSIVGLEKLDMGNLDMLECVEIVSYKHLSVHIVDAPKLQEFHFKGCCYFLNGSCSLILTSCPGLRELYLKWQPVTHDLFCSLVTLCPFLERLMIDCCEMPQKVIISARYLTDLGIKNCFKVEAIEIDAPALVSFSYKVDEAEPLPHLSFKTIPSKLEIVYAMTSGTQVDTSRFVRLRNFLATYTWIHCFSVKVDSAQVVFDHGELLQAEVPPAFQHLKIDLAYGHPTFDEQTLIDGLLWSFHPKTISVLSETRPYYERPHSFVEVLSKNLLKMEKNPSCCGSSLRKCWRHDLKSAKQSHKKELGISFKLEWRK